MSAMSGTPGNSRDLVDSAAANRSFQTFGKALESAGPSDTLRGAGPFTLIAPTDAAFDRLPAGRLDIDGQPAPITMTAGQIGTDGPRVTWAGIGSSNGVLHGIDKANIQTRR